MDGSAPGNSDPWLCERRKAGMKINFTKKEYAALVEMILTADWVIHAHDSEPSDATKRYAELRRKVLSHHKEMGMEDAFEYAPEDDDYYETADYEENSHHMRLIEEYDERSLWETLATKLAHRDLAAQDATSTAKPLPPKQRAVKFFEIEGHYREELEENGLGNVRIEPKTGLH
jgi:dihydroneopterin aldolase